PGALWGSHERRKGKEEVLRQQTKELNERLQESVEEHFKSTENEIKALQDRKTDALKQEGVDTDILQSWRIKLSEVEAILAKIEENHTLIVEYRKEKRDYIDRIEEFKITKGSLSSKQSQLDEEYRQKAGKLAEETKECNSAITRIKNDLEGLKEDISETRRFLASPGCPAFLREMPELATNDSCRVIIRNIRDLTDKLRAAMEQLKKDTNLFRLQFKQAGPFGFPKTVDSDDDYLRYSSSVRDFVENEKIKDYQTTSNGLYKNILGLISREYSTLVERESEIRKVVNEVNSDFAKKSFAGVIRKIELRLDKSESRVISTLQHIHDFWSENSLEIGEANLFASEESENANLAAVEWLKTLSEILEDNKDMDEIRLTDNFSLKMKIDENENSTGWIENMRNVGSDGTDILVKAIINILLINVFKKRIGKRSAFYIHCMMDEIGKLADENIRGIVDFANARDIYIVNSAPKVHSPLSYRHIYMLSKDSKSNTAVHPILSTHQADEENSKKPGK
ncbi:MAG: ATP-binding protein, partial [Muribaculaceae bacterium]|nr:ATP-binding protein [Muribaculaceae bacterium]